MAQSDILIATSIAPGGRENVQAAAVQSWLALGFDIVSLNTPEEIDALEKNFQGVKFIPQMRTAKLEIGRPVIYISDILHHLKQSQRKWVGIINSDIYLPPNQGLVDFVFRNISDSLLFGPRQEVPEFGSGNGHMDPFGFDFFFMDAGILRLWPEQKFCLGMPFWDLWFPLIPIFAGSGVKKLISPVAQHIPHPTQRDDSFFMFNNEFAEAVLPQLDHTEGGVEAYRALVRKAGTQEALEPLATYLDELTRHVIGYIDRKSEKITLG